MSENKTNLEDFLQPTRSCDFNNPIIQNKVIEIVKGAEDKRDEALRIFYWIRDNIKFGISNIDARASRTLKKGYGECGNKTSLHIALLRSAGIPARMRVSLAQRDPLQPLIPKFVYNKISVHASHFWCECYLENQWISCESLLDKPLYESLLKQGKITKEQIPTIDWDGKNDLIVLKNWIVEDRGYVNSYDDIYTQLIKNRKKEGLPPKIIEKLFGDFMYNRMFKFTEKVRRG
ncbi:MAG: transglutaminase-like domain-containing protein [Candidatus Heimdallarchaeaceae archaeon]